MKNRVQLQSFAIAPIILLTVLAIGAIEANFRQIETTQLRGSTYDALSLSKLKLTDAANKIASSDTIHSRQNQYSLQALLERNLVPGAVDQLEITSLENCTPVVHAKSLHSKPTLLKNCAQKVGHQFKWSLAKGIPQLRYSLRAPKTDLMISATVILNEYWLQLHPDLKKLWDNIQLSFVTQKKQSPKAIVNIQESPKLSIGIQSGHFFYQHLSWMTEVHRKDYILIISGLFLLSLLLILVGRFQQQVQISKDQATMEEFTSWCESLTDFFDQKLSKKRLQDLVFYWKESINRALERHSVQLTTLRHDVEDGRKKIKILSQEVTHEKLRSSNNSLEETLSEQVLSTTHLLQNTLDEAKDKLDDLQCILDQSIFTVGQSLEQLATKWQIGIKNPSPRKYLRSLSETVSEHGEDNLTHDVSQFISCSKETLNGALSASMKSRTLSQVLTPASHCIDYLITAKNASIDLELNKNVTMHESAKQAIAILKFDEKSKGRNLTITMQDKEAKCPIPSQLLQSCFYLVFKSIVDNESLNCRHVQFHIKSKTIDGQSYTIIQGLNNDQKPARLIDNKRDPELLKRIQNMLHYYNGECKRLPHSGKIGPIIISWKGNTKRIEGATIVDLGTVNPNPQDLNRCGGEAGDARSLT